MQGNAFCQQPRESGGRPWASDETTAPADSWCQPGDSLSREPAELCSGVWPIELAAQFVVMFYIAIKNEYAHLFFLLISTATK